MKLQPEPEKKEEITRWETIDDLSKKSLEECLSDSQKNLLEWSKRLGPEITVEFSGLPISNIQDQGEEEIHAEQPSEVQAS